MLKFACDEIEFWKVSHLQTFYDENQSIYSIFSRSSVSFRFPWLSGTFFTSLQCSTGGRSAKTICQAKKCHVKQKTKNHALHHQFNWNAWSCQLYQPDHLWSLLLFREKLSAATDINHEVRFSQTRTRFAFWCSSTRATRIKLSQPDIFHLRIFRMVGLRRSELFLVSINIGDICKKSH